MGIYTSAILNINLTFIVYVRFFSIKCIGYDCELDIRRKTKFSSFDILFFLINKLKDTYITNKKKKKVNRYFDNQKRY